MITTHQAKKIIKEALDQEGLPYIKLTARTVDFTDLARVRYIFVRVHGWEPNPAGSVLKQLAVDNGFRVEFRR
jgi:hypothetical protein